MLCTAGLFYIKTILFTRKKILVLHKNNIPLKNKIAINFSNFPTELLNAIDAPKIFFMVFFRMIDLLVSIKYYFQPVASNKTSICSRTRYRGQMWSSARQQTWKVEKVLTI